jgi:hypothetical protein
MHPQLATIVDEFHAAQRRLHRLVERIPPTEWPRRTDPHRWSVSECVEHLNLTSRAFLPSIRDAIAEGRRGGGRAPARYRRDPMGWLLWRTLGPPVRFRVKTRAPFVPSAFVPPAELVTEFDRLQAEQIAATESADGLPLQALRIVSPFAPGVRYNLYSTLSILPRHQERHLWQAEQVHVDVDHRRVSDTGMAGGSSW